MNGHAIAKHINICLYTYLYTFIRYSFSYLIIVEFVSFQGDPKTDDRE